MQMKLKNEITKNQQIANGEVKLQNYCNMHKDVVIVAIHIMIVKGFLFNQQK